MIILDTIFLELLKTKTSPRPLSHQQNLIQIESAEIHQGLRANRSLFWCDIFFLIRLGGIKTDHGNINLKMSRVTFHNFEDIAHFKVTESSDWCIHQNYCVLQSIGDNSGDIEILQYRNALYLMIKSRKNGGERGIWTLETHTGLLVFETSAFSRTLPPLHFELKS